MGRIAERIKSTEIATEQHFKFILLFLAVVVACIAVYTMWTFRNTEQMVGASHAKLNGILDKLDAKIDAVRIEGLNELLASGKGTVEGIQPVESELAAFIAENRKNTTRLSLAAEARINQVGENLTSLKDVTDEGQRTVAASGRAITDISKATITLMEKYGLTGEQATAAIKSASEQTGKSLEALAKQIADPRWSTAADNLVAATGEANGMLVDFHKDLHATTSQMPHIMAQVDKTATNISRFSKVSIIAGIISNLANGFIPGLLR